jgi:DNA-binding CsgD family transcriptional regulator/tetratricopeptide (TPR) repeat protein
MGTPSSRDAGAPAATALRGRVTEMSCVDGLIAGAAAGAGGTVIVEGAAGIGKSRVLAEGCARARAAGLVVASGSADELDQVTPWRALLRAFGATDPPLLPESALTKLGGLADQRLPAVDEMRAALEAASSRQPVLVALDDLQWADPSTLLALGSLPPTLFSYPVAWLLARRPWPVPAPLDRVLERLVEAGANRVHLGPLTGAEATALAREVAEPGSTADLGRLVAAAEGNPFYLIELLKADGLPGAADTAGVRAEVPHDVRGALRQHLRPLSAAGRHLLSVASVLGREFSVAELAAMTGQPASQLLAPVEETLQAEFLVEAPDGLAFRHDLLRQAVYESVPASVRVALHRDAADALRRTGAPLIRIAGQLAIGARPGDEEAVTALRAAATQLLGSAPKAAADMSLTALKMLDDRDDRRPGTLLTAVHALSQAGRGADAFALAEPFLAERTLPVRVEAELQLELREAWAFDRQQAYPSALPRHVRTDPTVAPAVLATAVACEQVNAIWEGHGDEADKAFDVALRAMDADGRSFDFATITYLRVLNSMLRGRMAEALQRAEAGIAAARRRERPRSSGIHETIVAVALGVNGRYREALSALQAAVAAAEAAGRADFLVHCQWLRALYLLQQGRLDDARGEARTAVATAEQLNYAGHRSHALTVLAEVALRQGDTDAAYAALAQFGSPEETGLLFDRYWVAALAADSRRDTASACQALQPICDQVQAGCYAIGITQHHRLPQLLRIALRGGQTAAAGILAAGAQDLARRNPQADSLVAAGCHAQGMLEHDQGLLVDAVRRAELSEAPLIEAAAREDLAGFLTGAAAVDQLERAYALHVQAGAHHDTARVRAALRGHGVRKRQASIGRPQQGWGSLTASELTVVDLVARGLSNREAAAKLFLSPETINTHLRHAFAKLGIRSRVDLARLAAQRTSAGRAQGGQRLS